MVSWGQVDLVLISASAVSPPSPEGTAIQVTPRLMILYRSVVKGYKSECVTLVGYSLDVVKEHISIIGMLRKDYHVMMWQKCESWEA